MKKQFSYCPRLFITIFPRPHRAEREWWAGAWPSKFFSCPFFGYKFARLDQLRVWRERENEEFIACGLHTTDGKFAFRFWLSPGPEAARSVCSCVKMEFISDFAFYIFTIYTCCSPQVLPLPLPLQLQLKPGQTNVLLTDLATGSLCADNPTHISSAPATRSKESDVRTWIN